MAPRESVSVSIEVDAPIWRVYQNWRKLERFPEFVPSVKEARWLNKRTLLWREEYQGQIVDCTYEVLMQPFDNGLTWSSLTGPESSGMARCDARANGKCEITLIIHFQPDDAMQSAKAIKTRHQDFLRQFKRYIETPKPRPTESAGTAAK